MTLAADAPTLAAPARYDGNPFVSISPAARVAIVVFFLVWRILPKLAQLTTPLETGEFYVALNALVEVSTEILLLLPMLYITFAGSRIGWVHPLVLPTLVAVAFTVLKSPQVLLAPVVAWFPEYSEIRHELLVGWPTETVRAANLKKNAMELLALLSLYAGFAAVRRKRRASHRTQIHFGTWRFVCLFLLFLAVVALFLQLRGGVIAHMTSFALGRFSFRETTGQFLIVNEFLPYMLILWYLLRPRSLRNPLFLAAFALVCILQFVVIGSRTALFTPVAVLMAAWMMRNSRIPAVSSLLYGLVVVMLIGVLGEIRRSGHYGTVDFSLLTNFDLAQARELAAAEEDIRTRGASLAVAAMVPDARPHLWGTTYVAAVGFWIPRSIWRDKPRGAGAHTAAILYGGRDTAQGYDGGGIPPGAAAEAYWNFSWPGIAVIFFLFGAVQRLFANWYQRDPGNVLAAFFLLLVIFRMNSPATIHIVSMLQSSVLAIFTYYFCRTSVRTFAAAPPGSVAR